jgi:hypothetical protein
MQYLAIAELSNRGFCAEGNDIYPAAPESLGNLKSTDCIQLLVSCERCVISL